MPRRPRRIRLSRAKGWRMPEGAVKVDRSTSFGNPFVVGIHGPRDRCVELFGFMLHGFLNISVPKGHVDEQVAARREILARLPELRGKDLACWCPLDQPCHADVLLALANDRPWKPRRRLEPLS